MMIELPDLPEGGHLTPEKIRLELACALYSRGQISKVQGAEMACVDFFTFQRALGERQISAYTQEMLADDLATLQKLFPS